MERHRSRPYNPNIANGFFRAGYVETRGCGIEKICEACKSHGVPTPEYILHLEDIMVKFVLLTQSKVPKGSSGTLEEKILLAIRENSYLTQSQIAIKANGSKRTVKRLMKKMSENGIIERIGGRKMGQWVEK